MTNRARNSVAALEIHHALDCLWYIAVSWSSHIDGRRPVQPVAGCNLCYKRLYVELEVDSESVVVVFTR
jgi:hypothetical protein